MAINQNHLFEDLDGVKCAVVEKNVAQERVNFLKSLLEYNGFNVVVVSSPPPKAAAASPTAEETVPVLPETFTVCVTDVSFNAINAIFGRLLKAPDGRVVTNSYWHQLEKFSDDSVPYFEKK